MGIRFYCPNGHKLNVKEHLAGKAGFCPECGARLIIPIHSTRKSGKELAAEADDDTSIPRESLDSQPKVPANSLGGDFSLSEPLAEKKVEPEVVNPILQDQSVIWYIRVSDGSQYGPVTGDVVHSWIKEHRIASTMLVWREGWANWLEAKNVFPELE